MIGHRSLTNCHVLRAVLHGFRREQAHDVEPAPGGARLHGAVGARQQLVELAGALGARRPGARASGRRLVDGLGVVRLASGQLGWCARGRGEHANGLR